MTVESTTRRAQYDTNGTTGPWTVPFYFLANADLEVIYTDAAGAETTLALTTHYSVTGAGVPSGGAVTTVSSYASGGTITVLRSVAILQETDYVETDAFPAAAHETALDRLTMIAQQQGEALDRTLTFPASDQLSGTLPPAATRANKLLAFDATGAPEESSFTTTQVASAIAAAYSGMGTADAATFIAAGTGATARTMQDKGRELVSIKDFGAVGNGITDDTAAIVAALAASRHVIVPAGMTPLVSSTITVTYHTKLEFLGGTGNTSGSYPSSYFIKKATMTTPAISISETGSVFGGGLVCQVGNTGDGVALEGNSASLREFLVHGAGGVGVRVGKTDGTNCNSFMLDHVTAQYNGSHGIYIHDGTAADGANANAGTLLQCFAQHNGGDGIRLGHAFWVTLINCLTEVNTGWGLYLSGTANNTYPECRWPTIIGGDFNEANVAGQIYDNSYFATFINPDQTAAPTTTPSGLQGGGKRTIIGSFDKNQIQGLSVENAVLSVKASAFYLDLQAGQIKFPATQISSADANTLDDYEEGTWTPAQAGVSLTVATATYTKIGRCVYYFLDVTWPATADVTNITITGWPVASVDSGGTFNTAYTTNANAPSGVNQAAGLELYGSGGVPSVRFTNAGLTGKRLIGSGCYRTAT